MLASPEDRADANPTPLVALPSATIDVLIPVYNAGTTVRSAVESIQRQTLTEIRIVVVNDGSTDDTLSILNDMAAGDPRIEVTTTVNRGIVDALNFGLTLCRAKYLARHDGDDLAYPDRLQKQLAYLEANPDCVAVGSGVRLIDQTGRAIEDVRLGSPDDSDPDMAPTKEPYIIHPFLMARLDAVLQAGGYRYVFHAEDTDLYWRLQEIGRLHNLPDILGDYRMHTASVSSSSLRNGRIAALYSQLSGLSAKRRRGNRPDLEFAKDMLAECNKAASMQEVLRLGSRGLATEEVRELELKLAGKILELTSYRPFELEVEDCRFVRRQLHKRLDDLTAENRAMLRRMCNGAVVRMLLHADFRRAGTLVWPTLYVGVLVRLCFRLATPVAVRRYILRSTGRAAFFK